MRLLYGPISNPFYIYAPRWIDTSAGIKGLHYLCHSLNQIGQTAFLILADDCHGTVSRVNGKLNTPILTQELAHAHFEAGLKPITLYSETIRGNPIRANYVVRFIANYLGLLGGPTVFPPNDFILSYSKKLTLHASEELNRSDIFTLFFHAIDPREFVSTEIKSEYVLYYAAKYRLFVGKPELPQGIRAIEIVRDGPEAQPREEVKRLLGSAKALITYENSAIVMESILSGTPAILIRSDFFHEGIAEDEVSMLGMRWGYSEDNIEAARAELAQARDLYLQSVDRYFVELEKFVRLVQSKTMESTYHSVIQVPEFAHVVNKHRISLALGVLRTQGLKRLIVITIAFLMRRMAKKKRTQD